MALSDQLRQACIDYGTTYRLWKDISATEHAVALAQLQRFIANQRSIHITTADRLSEFFGLHLVKRRKRK
ncbi:MAG: hypothetical protein HQ581_13150 [Planctomycetes bacterium]|nr:hypothetical protein [Planctomycetota bacterium]